MKIKHRLDSIAALLVVFISVTLLGTARPANAQEVHALLIILGNDRNIRVAVGVNETQMVQTLRELSHRCPVHLSVMKSENALVGKITRQTFVDGTGGKPDIASQDIIRSEQVAAWLAALKPKAEDTVLIYYSGHGEIGTFDAHSLIFNTAGSGDALDRERLSKKLRQKRARLLMLITDTCSTLSQDLPPTAFSTFVVDVRARAQHDYPSDLFLKHEGFLDITAASPSQLALGHDTIGGHFTSALLSQGFTAAADTNKDNFVSWSEAFAASVARTKRLFEDASADLAAFELQDELQKNGQTTQTPIAHSLPTRIDGGAVGAAAGQPPPPAHTAAILNFTSVPAGAEVSIDGFIVGQTPLENYELETDGQSTKEIEVTVKAAGYEERVKKFRVRRGHPFPYKFELDAKVPKPFIVGQDGAEMVLIPVGEFQMGSNDGDDDERPVHTVYVDAFYMDKYEVTVGQYKKFVQATGHRAPDWNFVAEYSPTDQHPIIVVSWHDAMAYAQWAGKRLPTEAEWEKAARGSLKGQKYPWGNSIDSSKANYGDNGTTVVGRYPANGYGLYDMAGNVWEWCLDAYSGDFYARSPRDNPFSGGIVTDMTNNFTNVNSSRVLRGGSWGDDAQDVRVAYRSWNTPTNTLNNGGFRCVRAVSP